MKTFIGEAKT